MPRKEILDRIQKYIQPFRVIGGLSFQLKYFDPGNTCGPKLYVFALFRVECVPEDILLIFPARISIFFACHPSLHAS